MLEKLTSLFKSGDKTYKTTESKSNLMDTVPDTLTLITIAAKLGIEISDKDIAIFLTVQDSENYLALPIETQVQFWSAYEKLLIKLKPMDIDSINAIHKPIKPGLLNISSWFRKVPVTLADKSVSKYRGITSLTLLIIILFQIYWFSGSSLINDIQSHNQMIASEKVQLATLQRQLHDDQTMQTNIQKSNAAMTSAGQALNSKIEETEDKIGIHKGLIEQHQQWREASILDLTDWNKIWSKTLFFVTQPWQTTDYESMSLIAKDRTQFVTAQFALKALSEYLLPLLYGLLGACFYILRRFPEEIRNYTFSKNSCVNYSLRLSQGPLAGIICGFFFASDSAGLSTSSTHSGIGELAMLANLSPLAIAFLAGYSVDTFLKVMDHMISLLASIASGKKHETPNVQANPMRTGLPASSSALSPTASPTTSRPNSDDTA